VKSVNSQVVVPDPLHSHRLSADGALKPSRTKHLNTRPQNSAERSARYAWVVAIASLTLLAIGTGAQYLVVVGLKPISADLQWPRSIPSFAYALSMLGMGVGGIVMGKWSDRRGAHRPALLAALMIPAGAYIAGSTESAIVFMGAVGLFIGFLGTAGLFAPLVANITYWLPRRRGLAVAIVTVGQSLGGAMWPPVHRYFMDHYGWRDAFLGYAIFALISLVPLALCLLPKRPMQLRGTSGGGTSDVDPGYRGTHLGVGPTWLLWLLGFAIIGCCVAMSMPMVHVVAHASDLGFPAARAAEILSVLLGGAVIARLAWGVVGDRIGGLATLLIGAFCQAIMLSTFVFIDSLAGLYIAAALYGLAYGGIVPTYAVIIREYMPLDRVGSNIGAIFLFGTVGMAAGGMVGGIVFDYAGNYFAAFGVGVAFNVANLAIVGPLTYREFRHRRASVAHGPAYSNDTSLSSEAMR
jgi:MFS family permease